jgi:hypothetical protein
VWLGIFGLLLIVIGVVLIRHLHLTVAIIGPIVGISWMPEGRRLRRAGTAPAIHPDAVLKPTTWITAVA